MLLERKLKMRQTHDNLIKLVYADMAELADAPDLGSGGKPCRFKSCYPQHEGNRYF